MGWRSAEVDLGRPDKRYYQQVRQELVVMSAQVHIQHNRYQISLKWHKQQTFIISHFAG